MFLKNLKNKKFKNLKNSQVCFELNEIKLYDCVELEPISALVFNFVGDLA